MSELRRTSWFRVGLPGVAFVVLAICLSAAPAISQILYGSIVGVVKDGQGAFVPGATVTIVNKETNLTRETVTNAEGAYSVLNVLPGQYDVKVGLTGFRENDPGQRAGHDRRDLPRRHVARARHPDRNRDGRVGGAVAADRQGRREHGTAVGRDHRDSAQPVPQLSGARQPRARDDADGVRQRGNGHAGAVARDQRQRPGEHEQFDPHRRRHEHEHLAAEPQHVISPAETIDTVNVSTSSFDAEQGMAGGAAVTVITKSGTNNFRGSAFEFFMNEKMNATPYYFGTAAQTGQAAPRAEQLRRHLRRADLAEQGVLLRIVRRATSAPTA